MKKLTAILFLTIFLLQNTGIHELLKISTLFDHYNETRQLDGQLSFTDFLFMHYITDDHDDQDNERDRQLPFKSSESLVSGSMVICMPVLGGQHVYNRTYTYSKPVKFFAKDIFIDSAFSSFVWHPPRNPEQFRGFC